jgi:DnaK suppressor protein
MARNQSYDFRQILEELLIETSSSHRDIRQKLKRPVWTCADENDRGSLESECTLLLAQAYWTSRLIRQIKEALKLIEDGQFGVCSCCEEDINPRRLLVYPTARYCAQCQEILDSEKGSEFQSVPG